MVAGSVRLGCAHLAVKIQEQWLALFENGRDISERSHTGHIGEDPFPLEAFLAAREGITDVVWQHWEEWTPSGDLLVRSEYSNSSSGCG